MNSEKYAYLLGLYLWDGCLSPGPRQVFKLRISLDEKYPRILAECEEAIRGLSEVRSLKAGRVQREGCVEVYSYWKHWICLFPQHGAGRKHLRPIRLQPWQAEIVEDHPDRFLRGLIHSDGWRGLNHVKVREKKYEYSRYQFTNNSKDIRGLFCKACDDYGVSWRQMNWKTISVARREDVAKLDSVIGPKC